MKNYQAVCRPAGEGERLREHLQEAWSSEAEGGLPSLPR